MWFCGMCWACQVTDISVEEYGWTSLLATPPPDNMCRVSVLSFSEEPSKLLCRKPCSQNEEAERGHGSSMTHCVIFHFNH